MATREDSWLSFPTHNLQADTHNENLRRRFCLPSSLPFSFLSFLFWHPFSRSSLSPSSFSFHSFLKVYGLGDNNNNKMLSLTVFEKSFFAVQTKMSSCSFFQKHQDFLPSITARLVWGHLPTLFNDYSFSFVEIKSFSKEWIWMEG